VAGKVHFTETREGILLVCLQSLMVNISESAEIAVEKKRLPG
jgi:hypothetical protein